MIRLLLILLLTIAPVYAPACSKVIDVEEDACVTNPDSCQRDQG